LEEGHCFLLDGCRKCSRGSWNIEAFEYINNKILCLNSIVLDAPNKQYLE
jgi:hypothetical protein